MQVGESVFISVIGHSLGGLVSQMFVSLLFANSLVHQPLRAFVERIKPCSFMSVCSPHLGARKCGNGKAGIMRGLVHGVIMKYALMKSSLTLKELMMEDTMTLQNNSIECDKTINISTLNTADIVIDSSVKSAVDYSTVPIDYTSMHKRDNTNCMLHFLSDPDQPPKRSINRFKCWAVSCLKDDIPVGFASAAIQPTHPIKSAYGIEVGAFTVNRLVNGRTNGINVEKLFKTREQFQLHPIEIESKPFHHNTPMTKQNAFLSDTNHELEYHPALYEALLQSTQQWNMIYLDFSIRHIIERHLVHPLAIGKKMYGVSQATQLLADECGGFLGFVIINDYLDQLEFNKKMMDS